MVKYKDNEISSDQLKEPFQFPGIEIKISRAKHEGENVLLIKFPYNFELNEVANTIEGATWSPFECSNSRGSVKNCNGGKNLN